MQFAHELDYETPHAPLPQEPGIGPDGYAPQVSIAPNGFCMGRRQVWLRERRAGGPLIRMRCDLN
jgi:hypothetical protein